MANTKDSLTSAAGKGVTVMLNDKEYEVRPLTLGDLADFEAYVRSQRLKSFLDGSQGMPEVERLKIVKELCSSPLPDDAVVEEMRTLDGVRFLFWRALKHAQPDITLAEVSEMVTVENLDLISTVVESIGGVNEANPPKAPQENT